MLLPEGLTTSTAPAYLGVGLGLLFLRQEQLGIVLFLPGLRAFFSSDLGRPVLLCKPLTLSLEEGRPVLRIPWNRKAFFCGSDKITLLLSRQRSDFPRNRGSQAPALLAVGSLLRIRL